MPSCLCDSCAALCCRYFVLEIDTPQTRRQFDDVRWYLVHEGTFAFIEKKKWYLGVYARCKHLGKDNRCGIYSRRPVICRQYSTDNCDYHGGEYNWEILFSSAEQLDLYAKDFLREQRAEKKTRRKKRKPAARPKGRNGSRPSRDAALLMAHAVHGHEGNLGSNGKSLSLPVLRGR